ncbi:MlaD family protein [Nocardia huaxiensis]|uniref:MCE family protein n=1 Tax=Nocardia huaxiensis TaxID=2755382 RepID=A0A7D6V9K2_9NOCA|nr:MlaD family protein [Nocardia huaxiensis]QLY27577.1 MCE family protein [Nocardia huaxiensis]UFS99045.1 MlaD family protein [Nocardia huaxiensis]
MQELNAPEPQRPKGIRARLAALTWHPNRHESTLMRRELGFGLFGAMALAAVLFVTGLIYVLPIGKTTYTADLSEARSVRVGNEVRIAGIHVGTVKSLKLMPDRVRMTFTVNDDVTLGDLTTLEVRMLTVVGGHYIAAFPAGDKPLGDAIIPADRVRLPYSLIRTLQDAATPIAEVDGDTLRKNFAALQDSLSNSPDALRRMGNAVESLVGILDKQNSDISQALTVTNEYLTAISANVSLLGTFLRKIGELETRGLAKKAEIAEALLVTSQLLSRIAAIEPAWAESLEPLADKLMEAVPALEDLGRRLDRSLTGFAELAERLRASVTPADGVTLDQSAVTVSAVCIPLPGTAC